MSINIDEQLANFRQARAIVEDSLTDLDKKIDLLTQAKKLLQTDVTLAVSQFSGQENPNKFVPTQAKVVTIAQTDVDTSCIAGCDSIPTAMFAWADAHDGEVKSKMLAPALRKTGLSVAKNDHSLAATIHNIATKSHVQHWEKVAPNHFRRKSPETDAPEPNSAVSDPPIERELDPLTDH